MKRLTKMFKGGQKGFTLIELLIVIVILGVLAAAIIPNLSKFMGSGQLGAANAELASVRTGVAAYQADNNGTAPTSVDGAAPVTGGNGIVVNSVLTDYITGKAIIAEYTFTASTGDLVGTDSSYTPDTDIIWDDTNECWMRQ